MRRAVVHIGTPKTCTSTLQAFRALNAERLKRQG
jgi:hypothetical protein